jgi:hypothetical protein
MVLAPFSSQTSVRPITDFQPAVRDNEDRIGAAKRVPVSRDGYRIRHESHFGKLFDNPAQ